MKSFVRTSNQSIGSSPKMYILRKLDPVKSGVYTHDKNWRILYNYLICLDEH
jgi:hypothetical protein